MSGAADFQRSKTHCPKGHPYDEANTKHTKDGRACKTCRREQDRAARATPEGREAGRLRQAAWRERNRDHEKRRAQRRRRAEKEWLEQARSSGCIKCGDRHPGALDFHHRDPATKEFQIGRGVLAEYSRERVLREITKCDILCASCHRKLHYDERQGEAA